MYREQKEMSLGLGNTNGEEWYKLRSNCIQRMLRPKEVSHHLPSVDKTAKLFLDKLSNQSSEHSNNQVPQLRELVGRWSLENAGMLVFDKYEISYYRNLVKKETFCTLGDWVVLRMMIIGGEKWWQLMQKFSSKVLIQFMFN